VARCGELGEAIVAEGDETPAYPGFVRSPLDLAKAREKARGIGMAAAELRKVAPHSGSYFNEGSFFNASWREEFWGATLPSVSSCFPQVGFGTARSSRHRDYAAGLPTFVTSLVRGHISMEIM